ncbi:MAG: hypothetical protein ABGY75_00675 [Gemmataceae bacterium]
MRIWVIGLILGAGFISGCTSPGEKKPNPLFDPPSGDPFKDSYYSAPATPVAFGKDRTAVNPPAPGAVTPPPGTPTR